MELAQTNVRLPKTLMRRFEFVASQKRMSKSALLRSLIEAETESNPPFAVVRHCQFDIEEFYTASLGDSINDFYEGSSRKEAFAAAKSKLTELGLDRARIEFKVEKLVCSQREDAIDEE